MFNLRILYLPFIIFFATCLMQLCKANTQQKIKPIEIKTILLSNSESYFGGSTTVSIELVYERGMWNSYQTSLVIATPIKRFNDKSSYVRRQIATLDTKTLDDFLNSVAVIKPKFNWKMFGINTITLKADLQKDKNSKAPRFEDLINDKTIEKSITTLRGDNTLDDAPYCRITIIKKNKDTIRIESGHQSICMLPWLINKEVSYDVGISNFFVLAMGKEEYINKARMQTSFLKRKVWEELDGWNPTGALFHYRWNYGYPKNMNLLKSNFAINVESISGSYSRCKLQSRTLPKNVFFDAGIDIANTAYLERLIKFRDTVDTCLKTSNFVFKHYSGVKNAKILFETNAGLAHIDYLPLRSLEREIPHIKTVNQAKLINFFIESPEGKSQWVILSDNTLILLDRSGDKVAGLSPEVFKNVKQGYYDDGHRFILLNADGKVLPQ